MKTYVFRSALTPVSAAALLLMAHSAVLAQNANASANAEAAAASDGDQKLETVVITGSRIRGIAPVGAVVNSLTRENIETSGATTTAQLVQQLPQVFNLGVSENSRGQPGGSTNITYGASINLRGIGPYATLVLVNGHRVVGQGTTGSAVDPSILPTLALDRVEIVADGASALYGSDAIAGVANLIMRRNEKGVQAYARFGVGDAFHERQLGGLAGLRWDGGNATFTYEKTHRSALNGRDRDFFKGDLTSQGGGDFRSTQCSPGNIVISGVTYPIPASGITAANAASLVAGAPNKCDNFKVGDLLPEQHRDSFAMTAEQKFGAYRLFADVIASKREYSIRPSAFTANLTVPSTNPFYVRPPTAPAGTSETVTFSFINDVPLNTATGKSKTLEATVGLEVPLWGDWRGSGLVTRGENRDISTSYGGVVNPALAAALADKNPATALNVFGGPNNPTTIKNVFNGISFAPGHVTFDNLAFKADGAVMTLPGGKMRMALGLEGQDITTVGGQTSGTFANPTTGEVTLKRRVKSAYGELVVPIVGASNAMPGIRSLSLSLAARKDHYSDVGSTSNPKLGMTWQPVDSLSLRGSYGESFRAPVLTQIRGFTNGGRGGLFVQNYSDPTINGALRVGVALSAANYDLKPESAKTKTLGFDWKPAIGTGTKLSATWFDINYDNQIVGALADLTILNRESTFAGTPIIQRNPSPELVAQLLATYPVAGVPPATWTLFVDGRQFNVGRSKTQGFDFEASTRFNDTKLGDFLVGVNGTVFTKHQMAQTPAGALTDQLNTIYNPMKFKSRFMANWAYGAFQTNLTFAYINGYKNNLANPVQNVASIVTTDLRVAYAFETDGPMGLLKDATVAIGAINLFNKKPPFVNVAQSPNGGGGFDPTLTSPVGRVVSISLDKRF